MVIVVKIVYTVSITTRSRVITFLHQVLELQPVCNQQ